MCFIDRFIGEENFDSSDQDDDDDWSSEEFENDDELDGTGGDDIVEDDLLPIFQGEVDDDDGTSLLCWSDNTFSNCRFRLNAKKETGLETLTVAYIIGYHTPDRKPMKSKNQPNYCNCLKKYCLGDGGTNQTPMVDLINAVRRYVDKEKPERNDFREFMKSYLQSKQSQTYIRCTACYQLLSVISIGSTMPKDGKLWYNYTIGAYAIPVQPQRIRVCPTAFRLIYGLTKANLEGFQRAIKHNIMFGRTAYNDQTKVAVASVKRLEQKNPYLPVNLNSTYVHRLTQDEVSLALKSNNVKTKIAHMFLEKFFNLVGDKMPTSEEIHLDPMEKKKIWKEYCHEVTNVFELDESYLLKKTAFCVLWKNGFPHVKIREYKAVTGKCTHCAILSFLRSTTKNSLWCEEISDLHVLHRVTFMSERKSYYERLWLAITEPQNYMSIIIDGMAQTHTRIPWSANIKEFPTNINQHLQGIIEHGQGFTMYRTFNNLTNDANLNIHCLLLQLESRIERYGKLPDTIFIQVDGGSENANKYILAMCELLVHRGMTREIYLTRLPVGHTHEDIDAKFALLWKRVRTEHVLSPQHYASILKEVYGSNSKSPFKLHEIYVVPDYKEFLDSCIDTHFANWTKEENTQHCFRFRSVPISAHFPLGVQTTYRAYWSDKVYELIKPPIQRTLTGYSAVRVHSFWGPQERQSDGSLIEGLHLLESLPDQPLYPARFQDNFLTELKATMNAVDRHPNIQGVYAEDWEIFARQYPQSDDVESYVQAFPHFYNIPMLYTTLFSFMYVDDPLPITRTHDGFRNLQFDRRDAESNAQIANILATHSIRWRKRYSPIPSRYSYPSDATVFGLVEIAEIELQGLLNTPNDRLKRLLQSQLKTLCQHYELNTQAARTNDDFINL